MVSTGMATPLGCYVWSKNESGRNMFASRLPWRIGYAFDVNVPFDSKSKGLCLGRAKFISVRIPTSGGLFPHAINTFTKLRLLDQQSCFSVSRNYQLICLILRLRTTLTFHMRRLKL